jgi:hypothetical protein
MFRWLFLLSVICSVSIAEEPTEQAVEKLLQYYQEQNADSLWQLYPITCFPPLKGQAYPWEYECDRCYRSFGKYRRGIVCITTKGTCYIGSKYKELSDSLFFYTVTKYSYNKRGWQFLMDYVVITNFYNKIVDVVKRNSVNEEFSKVVLYNK